MRPLPSLGVCTGGWAKNWVSALNLPAPHLPHTTHGMITINIPPRQICGVYFLFLDRHLTYIGQSINVLRRLGQHAKAGLSFSEAHIIEAVDRHLVGLEIYYITTLSPPGNTLIREYYPKYKILAEEYGLYHLPDGYDAGN